MIRPALRRRQQGHSAKASSTCWQSLADSVVLDDILGIVFAAQGRGQRVQA